MRQVAVALKIDLNTVQRAYAELERDGILTLVQGRGTFVAEASRRVQRSKARQRSPGRQDGGTGPGARAGRAG